MNDKLASLKRVSFLLCTSQSKCKLQTYTSNDKVNKKIAFGCCKRSQLDKWTNLFRAFTIIYMNSSRTHLWYVCVCVCILFTDQNALVLIWQMHFVGNLYCEKWAIADIYICNGNGSNATKLAVNNCPCRIFCSSLGTNPNETFIIWTSHDSDASV